MAFAHVGVDGLQKIQNERHSPNVHTLGATFNFHTERRGSNRDVPRGTLLQHWAMCRIPIETDAMLYSVESITEG